MMRVIYISEEAAQALFDGEIPVAFPQRPEETLNPYRFVQRWIDSVCVTGSGHETTTAKLYNHFKDWMSSQQAPPMPPATFAKALTGLGFRPITMRDERGVVRGFDGITLRPRSQEEDPDLDVIFGGGSPPLAVKAVEWMASYGLETGSGLSASVSGLYASFRQWCDENYKVPVTLGTFIQHLQSLGFGLRKTPAGEVFTGIGFPEYDDEDTDDQEDGDPEDKAIIFFFEQWFNQMDKVPGHTVNEDKLYMCYHRYCMYYHEVPMTLTGFRAAMAATGAPPDDVLFVNADLKEYCGIKIPVQFMFRMYGEMPF
jgi:hypothetical protein